MTVVVNWNFERRGPNSRQAATMMDRIATEHPDVVCLTEAHEGSTTMLDGHEIAARGATWSFNRRESERLVVLWSSHPWRDVDAAGNDGTATGGAGGTRIDAALQRLRALSVLTQADVERMRGELHGASP